jgi:hypothetical protein
MGRTLSVAMPTQKSKSRSPPRGAQEWIVETLRNLPAGARLSTSRLAKRIAKASGRRFHENSVYNALRALVRSEVIGMVRAGREKLYFVKDTVTRRRSGKVAGGTSATPTIVPSAPAASTPLPHRLGLGDILVLRIDHGVVLTATNLHGKLVFEHHRISG